MKIEEIKSKTDSELTYELGKIKRELFDMRFKARTSGSADPSRIRVLRRAIARVHTVQAERRRAAQAQAVRSS